MEKQKLFVNDPMSFSIEIQSTNSFFSAPNWDKPMDQNDPFESALTSMVSSPVGSNASTVPGGGDGFTIGELIGRLGNICNSGEISPHSYTQNNYSNNNNNNSTNTSCYSTPLNSPPKLNLSSQIRGNLPVPNKTHLAQLAADPGFAERAARFSNFISNRNFSSHITNNNNHSMELSGLSSNQSMKGTGIGSGMTAALDVKLSRISRSSTPEKGEFGDSKEESSLSEQIPIGDSSFKAPIENSRKRKAISRVKPKETSPSSKVGGGNEEESNTNNAKRSKQEEKNGGENDKNANDGNQKQNKENSKAPSQAPPKDYIHVRARRGQATDSHSLAERVRREKISERMKFLQDLVPGCNKVTGKAVMLDEIINYVQSLQRQVEFLSMKLATVNPRMEALLSKDMYQSHRSGAQIQCTSSAATFPFGYNQGQGLHLPNNNADSHLSMNPLNATFQFNGYGEEIPSYWDDDLQSLVQMGFSNMNQPPSFPGSMATSAQAKLEL